MKGKINLEVSKATRDRRTVCWGVIKKYSNNDKKIPVYAEKKRPVMRNLSKDSQVKIDEWFRTTGAKMGVLTEGSQNKFTRLLYTLRNHNSTDLSNLPNNDLYFHRVRLKEGIKLFSRPKQRCWPRGKEFMMRRKISDSLEYGLYESTIGPNGQLSD